MFRHVIVYIYVGVDFDNTMYTYYCIWYLHNAKLQGFSIKKIHTVTQFTRYHFSKNDSQRRHAYK